MEEEGNKVVEKKEENGGRDGKTRIPLSEIPPQN